MSAIARRLASETQGGQTPLRFVDLRFCEYLWVDFVEKLDADDLDLQVAIVAFVLDLRRPIDAADLLVMDKKHFVLDRLSRRENGIRVHSDQKAGLRVLPDEDYDRWLDPKNEDVAALQGLLRPYPAEEMAAFPISTLVHSPRNDRPECIERLSA